MWTRAEANPDAVRHLQTEGARQGHADRLQRYGGVFPSCSVPRKFLTDPSQANKIAILFYERIGCALVSPAISEAIAENAYLKLCIGPFFARVWRLPSGRRRRQRVGGRGRGLRR